MLLKKLVAQKLAEMTQWRADLPNNKWIMGDSLQPGRKVRKENDKKCQPAANDTPDIIKTECVNDSGLVHPKKIKRKMQ